MSRYKDLTGMMFGRLVVISFAGKNKHGQPLWKCLCDCGQEKVIVGGSLLGEKTRSCGCYSREQVHKNAFKDLSGQRFGRWLVVSFSRINSRRASVWNCRCDCGVEKEVSGTSLVSGRSKSCGCFNKDCHTTHGRTKTREYRTMISRKRYDQERNLDTNWNFEMECAIRNYQPCCVVCGMSEEEHLEKYHKRFHIDHVLPLSKGYGLNPGNAVVLCYRCNVVKNKRDLKKLPVGWQNKITIAAKEFKEYWDNKIYV